MEDIKFSFESTATIKRENLTGNCQACLSSERLKSMLETNYVDGRQEIYIEMFLNCFNIEIEIPALAMGEDESVILLICEACIGKLREACDFRRQVEKTQESLRNSLKKELLDPDSFADINDGFSSECLSDDVCKYEPKGANRLPANAPQNTKTKSKKPPNASKPKAKRKKRKCEKPAETETDSLPLKLDKNSLICQICSAAFTSHGLLVQHMPTHFPNFICYICGKAFLNKINLNSHVKRHGDEKVSCTVCSKLLKKTSLERHMGSHTGVRKKLSKCLHCDERFLWHTARQKHMIEVHGESWLVYKCDVCDKGFPRKAHLYRHINMVHVKQVNIICSECGKGFFSKYALTRHMLRHTGIRNFQCPVCRKSYLKKDTLQVHMRIHTNEKNYVCPICSRAFTYKCSLKGHMKTHSGDSVNGDMQFDS